MSYCFTDLVDIASFRSMLQSFYEGTGIMHGLVDAENNVISAIGWQEACTDFHRACPISKQQCEESNRCLAEEAGTRTSGFVGGLCLNGLMDYASPIVIEGKQMATLYFGQILHEPPDMAFFRRQARECGFDEEAYLEAIRKLPVIPRERIGPIMAFFSQLAQMLASSGLDRMREREAEQRLEALNQELTRRVEARTQELAAKNRQLAADVALRRETEARLREKQTQLQAILDSSPIGIGWSNHGKMEYINKRFSELFGYKLEELGSIEQINRLAFPDETLRKEVIAPWSRKVAAAIAAGKATPVLEAPVVCKDGSIRYGMINVSWIGHRRLINFSDITDRWQAERHNQARNKVSEMIATGAPLRETLKSLILSLEQEDPGKLGSILLLDSDGWHLRSCAAPSLPEFFVQAIDGIEIGDTTGACGTSAFIRQRVVIADIQSHPYWEHFRGLAARAGLAACCSEPMFSSKGRLLGTFTLYSRQPGEPSEQEFYLIEQAANLASIAIEQSQALEELELRAHTDSLTGLANRGHFMELAEVEMARAKRYETNYAVLLLDIDHFKAINDKYGHKAGDVVLQELASIMQRTLREVDIIGRIGGEEFAILLPHTDMAMAPEVAERLRQAVAEAEIPTGFHISLHITVSIGIAAPVDRYCQIDDILREADAALYAAKHNGRNRICIADAA
ncbi:MAG: diguanylate cyclase [Chromatiales bacterium]|jgi:diguanylate cyclase (GGDEF)-like protein/PAS domain S-box-containing protein